MCEVEKKRMRQKIMAIASRLGWDSGMAHEMFEAWGYGHSLRELSIVRLGSLQRAMRTLLVRNKKDKAKKRHSVALGLLAEIGGKFNRLERLEHLLVKKMNKVSWWELTNNEQKQVLAILRNYVRRHNGQRT